MSKAVEDVTEVAGLHTGASHEPEVRESQSSISKPPKKRVSQACSRCRSRKDKCDGKKPTCSACADVDEACIYDSATKKRGLPEGYVRGLEKLWGISLRNADGLESTILKIIETGDTDPHSLAKIWNDKEGNETLVETWRRSKVYQELDRLLPLLDLSDDKPGKRKRTDAGPAQRLEENPNRPPSTQAHIGQEQNLSPASTLGHPNDAFAATQESFGSKSSTIPQEISIRSTLPLPGRTWNLIDIYFSYTHCWFPIIEKHELLRLSYQYSHNESASSPHKSGGLAVLWAVLAYAGHQSRAINPYTTTNGPDSDWTVGRLYKESKAHIPPEEGDFELGHVQALLILTLLNIGQGRWSGAWILIGKAVRIAIELGFNHATDKKCLNAQVLLGCFVLDTLVALHLDRTPQLRVSDIRQIGTIDEDGLDEWNPWMDCLSLERNSADGRRGPAATLSTFNCLIRLTAILNNITHDESTGTRRANKCQELMDELGSCGEMNPLQSMSASNTSDGTSPPLQPHQYHLHIAHLSTVSAVYAYLDASDNGGQASNGTNHRVLAASAYKTMLLIVRHSEAFGLSIVPPTFACFIKVTLRGFNEVPQSALNDQHVTSAEWQERMFHSLSAMSTVWPAFKSLQTILKPNLTSTRNQSQPIPPSHPTMDRHITSQDQMITQLAAHPIVSDNLSGSNLDVRDSVNGVHYNRALSNNVPQSRDPPSVTSTDGRSSSWKESTASWNQLPSQPYDKVLNDASSAGTFTSHIDGDSTFNEFAALDAMEWNNNWDQGLLNLGFTETEMMRQDFNSFCQVPEPTSNDLVQQLLADAEVPHPLLGGIHGISDPNVLEASQTLRSMFKGW
ncbi:hypothetical protein V500_08387 [Pseudogymnoascus sp. VKM F-4518 (FW-2643)]|nr:hypothetical protein V500_08387 [Pseudogymnoascus sp. VKM F-4518 (FW-2643)]